MYEKGSHNTLYRGDVEIRIYVYDMHLAEGDELAHQDVYRCAYPQRDRKTLAALARLVFSSSSSTGSPRTWCNTLRPIRPATLGRFELTVFRTIASREASRTK